MEFFLGADAHWLSRAGYPLMISHGRLRRVKRLPRALAPWVCDSRGFTELSQHGKWTISPADYVESLRLYRDEIGMMKWASPQDYMCEPWIIAKTGLTVAVHLQRTVDNYLELKALAPELPIIPVLQGWELGDYLHCLNLYEEAGIDLTVEKTVGVGSVCRRQGTAEIREIISTLSGRGMNLHGFGVKTKGLASYGHLLASADSFAWAMGGRRVGRCTHGGVTWETNCPQYAAEWRDKVTATITAGGSR